MATPNADQVEYWNQTAGPAWVRQQRALDAQLAPLGERLLEAAAVAAGASVLDVGCGCGGTSLELARRTGAGGSVLGVDVSAPMLEVARERAQAAGLPDRLRFEQADAQVHDFGAGTHDAVVSRFGVMFFEEPPAAFTNLRRALRSGGRLTFLCWQGLDRNHWMRVPLLAAAAHVPLPEPPPPGAPGPFSLADAGRLRSLLAGAGFRDVAVDPLETETVFAGGGTPDEVLPMLLDVGPFAALLREVDESVRSKVVAAVRDAITPYATPEGVRMPAAAWLVTARAP